MSFGTENACNRVSVKFSGGCRAMLSVGVSDIGQTSKFGGEYTEGGRGLQRVDDSGVV